MLELYYIIINLNGKKYERCSDRIVVNGKKEIRSRQGQRNNLYILDEKEFSRNCEYGDEESQEVYLDLKIDEWVDIIKDEMGWYADEK